MKINRILSLITLIIMLFTVTCGLITVSANTTINIPLSDATVTWHNPERSAIPVHDHGNMLVQIGRRSSGMNVLHSLGYGMAFEKSLMPNKNIIKSAKIEVKIREQANSFGASALDDGFVFETALYPMADIIRGDYLIPYMSSTTNPDGASKNEDEAQQAWITVNNLDSFKKDGNWDSTKRNDYKIAYKNVGGFKGYPNLENLTPAATLNHTSTGKGNNHTLTYDVTSSIREGYTNWILITDNKRETATGNHDASNTLGIVQNAGDQGRLSSNVVLKIELYSDEELLGIFNEFIESNHSSNVADIVEAIAKKENISFGAIESGYFEIIAEDLMPDGGYSTYNDLKNDIVSKINSVTTEDFRVYKLGLYIEELNSELQKTDDFSESNVKMTLEKIYVLANTRTYLTVYNSLGDEKKSEMALFLKGKTFSDDSDLNTVIGQELLKIQVEIYPIIENSVRNTPIQNNETGITLKLNGFVFKVSADGENKVAIPSTNNEASFILEKTSGTAPLNVDLTRSGDDIAFADTLSGEQEYKFSWSNVVAGGSTIADGYILFTTTGRYVNLNTELSNGMLLPRNLIDVKEDTTTELNSLKGVLEISQFTNSGLDISNVEVTLDTDNKSYTYDSVNKKFTSTDIRGVSDVKFTYTNEDNSKISVIKKIFVYNSVSLTPQADTEYIVFNIKKNENPPYGTTSLGEVTYNHKGNFEEQVVVDLKNNGKVYVDGIDIGATMTASDCAGFQDVKYINLSGEKCYATYVKAKEANGTLYGTYTYNDSDTYNKNGEENSVQSDLEDKTTVTGTSFRWLYLDNDGTYKPFATSQNVSVTSDIKGKYVKFEVTPKNKYEQGDAVASEPIYIAKDNIGGNSGGNGGGTSFRPVQITNPAPTVKNDTSTTPVSPVSPRVTYTDVPEGFWAKPFIDSLTEKGVLTGMGDGTFLPSNFVKRGEFVCALVKALELTTEEYTGKFGDVAETDWFAVFVETAVKNGIINGFEDGTFRAEEGITKEQLCVIASNVLKLTETGELTFKDLESISDWASAFVKKAYKAGIVSGDENGYFNPKSVATRAEMAKIVSLIMENAEVK